MVRVAAKKEFLGILALSLMTSAVASAQTISSVSCDGQVAPQGFIGGAPCPSGTELGCMIVVVKDFQGRPQPGVAVTWTILSGGGALTDTIPPTTTTDANGQSAKK